ncbi:MAG: DMT family transporter [Desulfobacterales bacterium]|nr:DMT family transporter [Desulfobacterales bacterium]
MDLYSPETAIHDEAFCKPAEFFITVADELGDMAPVYAILSAFLYALSNVITKKGFQYASPIYAAVISLLSCFAASLILCLFVFSPEYFLNNAILFFLAAGAIGPFLGRLFLYASIDRVGPSIASTLFESKPLFSVLLAVMVLGESLSPAIITGLTMMMAGTVIISFEREGGEISKKWTRKDLFVPLLAGLCYGGSHVLRKPGITAIPVPIVAVMFQNASALALAPLLSVFSKKQPPAISNRKAAWAIFIFAGILQVGAQWSLFAALKYGTVVVVSPLTSLSTLFVLILAAFFLREVERITWKIVAGAILIISATVVLTAFS